MLRIENLTLRIGERVLFDRANVTIDAGHRVGFVGRNGTGKTTLLRLITGAMEPEDGRIEISPRWRVGVTRQEAPSGPEDLIATVLRADRELARLERAAEIETDPSRISDIHERLRDIDAAGASARAARILAGLGFDHHAQQQPLNSFSGGWRMRIMLAQLLFTRPDLLLLDEPTNHLDLEATMWLEDFLQRYDGTVLIVSHDRGLLNRVAGQILHLDQARLTLYQGGYDRFETTRRMQIEQDQKQHARQELQRRRIQKYVDRFRYKATKARQAQSRLKMLERMEPVPEQRDDRVVTFQFPDPGSIAPPIFSARGASAGYGGSPVLSRLSLHLDDGDRVALLGPNGNGKSTFLRFLAGRLTASSGHLVRAPGLRIGYFAQHQSEELDPVATPLIELERRRPRDIPEKHRSHLARFGFSRERAETTVSNLSGGEVARLLFALMSADRPHVLLLDEPTNHLDVESRAALIQAINDFAGAVIMATHDPHVIELTADRLWLVAGGTVAPFDGDMNDYREMLLRQTGTDERQDTHVPRRNPETRRGRRQIAADHRAALAPLRRDLQNVEQEIDTLTARKAELEAQLSRPEIYQDDKSRLTDLQKDLGRAIRDLVQAEEQWMALQEEWETLSPK